MRPGSGPWRGERSRWPKKGAGAARPQRAGKNAGAPALAGIMGLTECRFLPAFRCCLDGCLGEISKNCPSVSARNLHMSRSGQYVHNRRGPRGAQFFYIAFRRFEGARISKHHITARQLMANVWMFPTGLCGGSESGPHLSKIRTGPSGFAGEKRKKPGVSAPYLPRPDDDCERSQNGPGRRAENCRLYMSGLAPISARQGSHQVWAKKVWETMERT